MASGEDRSMMRLWLCISACLMLPSVPAPAEIVPIPASSTEFFSHNGVLTATLEARPGKVRVGDLELDATTYNGIYAGPVLHVHPGDVMRITLVNHLSQPTNLHFHGFRSSPLGNGDNAHLVVEPNTSFDYEVRIPPHQPAGLFWFHAHIHHLAEVQIMGGLSGTVVVEAPALPPVKQHLFILKDMVFDDETGNDEIDDEMHSVVQSVNGNIFTKETIRPGESQLWRISNQSANLEKHIALEGHKFRIVAQDGEPVLHQRIVEVLDLSPGSRFDVLVDGGQPGQHALLAKGVLTGSGASKAPDRVIGLLEVAGDPTDPTPSIPQSKIPVDLSQVRVDATRMIAFSQKNTPKLADQRFYINEQTFNPNRTDVRVPLGNIEEWTIRNDSDDIHIFHIHQIGFQVVEVNGQRLAFNGYVDTVRIPERGEIKVRMPFTDRLITGRFLFHCHVLRHEDKGMMGNIEIYDPSPSLVGRLATFYWHVVWWWHGVPWTLCGLEDA